MYIYTSAIGHLTLTYLQYPTQPSDQQKQCPLYKNINSENKASEKDMNLDLSTKHI